MIKGRIYYSSPLSEDRLYVEEISLWTDILSHCYWIQSEMITSAIFCGAISVSVERDKTEVASFIIPGWIGCYENLPNRKIRDLPLPQHIPRELFREFHSGAFIAFLLIFHELFRGEGTFLSRYDGGGALMITRKGPRSVYIEEFEEHEIPQLNGLGWWNNVIDDPENRIHDKHIRLDLDEFLSVIYDVGDQVSRLIEICKDRYVEELEGGLEEHLDVQQMKAILELPRVFEDATRGNNGVKLVRMD